MALGGFEPLAWAETALAAPGVAGAWAEADAALRGAGFENCTFVFGHPTSSRAAPRLSAKFGWLIDEEWESRLRTEPEIIANDPLSKRFLSGERALTFWRGGPLYQSFNDAEQRFFRHYEDHGLKAGAIWPSHDRTMGASHVLLSWSSDGRRSYREAITRSRGAVHLAMTYFCEALRVKELAKTDGAPALTPRERECLLWVQAGKSSKDISERLVIAEATVNEHVAGAMRKLKASGRVQAAARAIMLDLIRP
jgi:DNA-binding CsgD family transcriptional regulator